MCWTLCWLPIQHAYMLEGLLKLLAAPEIASYTYRPVPTTGFRPDLDLTLTLS